MDSIEEEERPISEPSPKQGSAVLLEQDTDESSHDDEAKGESFLTTVEEGEEDDDDDYEEEESLVEEPAIPLFQYSRIHGSLPRTAYALSTQRTCTALGQVVLSPESTTPMEHHQVELPATSADMPTELWSDEAIAVAAYGFADGQVWLVDALTGVAVAGPDQLTVRTGNRKPSIVGLSIDETGTFLAALDAGGMCTIFELRYAIRSSTTTASASTSSSPRQQLEQQPNMFGFLSAFTGGSHNSLQPSPSQSEENTGPQVPTLALASLQIHRISYPNSFGTPTCLALDPAYKRKRALVVGFADGRLVLTKRGFVFQRRSDAVLYQGTADAIQALVWRQNLVAWADASGVRLLDSETMQRIAHVDRPSGARPSLYPVVSAHPNLMFETANQLLVAWGDCLLTLHVRGGRKVECTMAWELDCIACGVAPLDEKYVVVLGLIPDDEEESDDHEQQQQEQHAVELQVVSRANGQVVFADALPLVRAPADASDWTDSTGHYQLLSSFALPPPPLMTENTDPNLFAGAAAAPTRVAHLEWSLDDVVVEDEQWVVKNAVETHGDTDSVDSDDYGFVLRPLEEYTVNNEKLSVPPTMLLACAGDAVLARTRNVDDAVSYALEQEKYALALHRALQHRQRLRRYDIADLVDEYLRALLRLGKSDGTLSMRRMKLAAKAFPKLLGGNPEAWEHWIAELEKLPGALFVAREYLPVRDPKLGEDVYARILSTMLDQAEEMADSANARGETSSARVVTEAEEQFLHTLLSWGTSHVLNDFVKVYEYQRNIDASFQTSWDAILASLERRDEQTAAVYLNFQGEDDATSTPVVDRHHSVRVLNDTKDALFHIDDVMETVKTRLSLDQPISSPRDSQSVTHMNSRVALDAMAKLCMMKGLIDGALKYFLVIGALHSSMTMQEVEEDALSRIALSTDNPSLSRDNKHVQYAFVIHLIEKYHLHQYVLDSTFLPEGLNTSPLFALAKLVGLDSLGDFLIANCVAPQRKAKLKTMPPSNSETNAKERRGTLPLDLVAAQLEASPKLLHWYLHLVFMRKPELYVVFPNTAIPPPIITSLHRKHLGLHIKYAGNKRDSAKVLEDVENYRVADCSTPLLSFLKGVLPLGGIGAIEVGKMLEVERRGGAGLSRTFALELAYIMEQYGNDTRDDAALVLELYLKGAQSLMLAVSFAQRTTQHSLALWRSLIEYCLGSTSSTGETPSKKENGALFGSLLEAAALSGADLAHLVKQIPHGMAVEGLRPRLVAAVADYRLKLQMHESASAIALSDKKDLLRECSHRSRRGVRYEMPEKSEFPSFESHTQDRTSNPVEGAEKKRPVLPTTLRPRQRCDRHSSAISLPIR